MSALATRTLGRTNLAVSVLGFGAAGIGNLYRELDGAEAISAVRASFEDGVRFFDTAPYYGFGLSELRLAQGLRHAQPAPVVSTKVGRLLEPTGPQDARVGREGYFSARPFTPVIDYGYDAVLRSHQESLQRLGLERINILLGHDIGWRAEGAAREARKREFLTGGYRAMHELRAAGAVDAIGIGVNEWQICVELLEHCDLDCILLAGRYTLLEQTPLDELLPLCARRGVSIICGAPFNSGVLAAGSRSGANYDYEPAAAAVLERVRALEQVCAEFNVPLQAAALQFPLAHPQIASVVAGCVSAAEARHCGAMLRQSIPQAFWLALRERGLIDARAPLPA